MTRDEMYQASAVIKKLDTEIAYTDEEVRVGIQGIDTILTILWASGTEYHFFKQDLCRKKRILERFRDSRKSGSHD